MKRALAHTLADIAEGLPFVFRSARILAADVIELAALGCFALVLATLALV